MTMKDIQQTLINMGYSVGAAGADGFYGKNTDAALRRALADLWTFKEGVRGNSKTKKLRAADFGLPDFLDNLPDAVMKRIVIHWTAGSYVASALDREHYHFIVDGQDQIIRGLHSVTDNVNVSGKSSDDYAAHTKNLNSGSIGISLAAMAGAVEGKSHGRYPILMSQFVTMVKLVAFLSLRYGIEVTPQTILTHAEVQPTLGVKQAGKWDITVLPFNADVVGAIPVGNYIRRQVTEERKERSCKTGCVI